MIESEMTVKKNMFVCLFVRYTHIFQRRKKKNRDIDRDKVLDKVCIYSICMSIENYKI